jgi:hypothetical protein
MAAGLGFKTFNTGDVLSAADVNGYLMQGVLVFASTAARDAAITAPAEGQFAFTKDTNSLFYYDGAAWVASGATGDIEGVTAGTGISGGGTSGTVTVTNSMATAIDAKGDLIGGTGADTFARLAVGANDTVLTADSSQATGLKWATPASGGGMTLLTSGALTGSSTVFSFTSTGYINIQIHFKNVWLDTSANGIKMRINADTGNNYANGRYQLSPTIGDGNQVTDHFLLTFRANGGSQAFYKNGHGIVTLYRPTDTDVIYMVGDCSQTDSVSSGDTWYNHIIGIYDCSAAVSSITLFPNANNFANGNAYVYGVK